MKQITILIKHNKGCIIVFIILFAIITFITTIVVAEKEPDYYDRCDSVNRIAFDSLYKDKVSVELHQYTVEQLKKEYDKCSRLAYDTVYLVRIFIDYESYYMYVSGNENSNYYDWWYESSIWTRSKGIMDELGEPYIIIKATVHITRINPSFQEFTKYLSNK